MSKHLADPRWRCPQCSPYLGLGGHVPLPVPPPARYAPAGVVKRALLMQPRTRFARARCARDSSLRHPLEMLVERAHHELEPPDFIAHALRLFLFLPALSLSLSLSASLFLSASLCRASRLAHPPRLPLSLFASA